MNFIAMAKKNPMCQNHHQHTTATNINASIFFLKQLKTLKPYPSQQALTRTLYAYCLACAAMWQCVYVARLCISNAQYFSASKHFTCLSVSLSDYLFIYTAECALPLRMLAVVCIKHPQTLKDSFGNKKQIKKINNKSTKQNEKLWLLRGS